ncbi:MAG: tetratricopeptide repeat protein [Pirellulaceae bacterium]|nr:tetratricopeptide repeat protein [Pirellulaceae bacterium]
MNQAETPQGATENELGNDFFRRGKYLESLQAYQRAGVHLPDVAAIQLNIGNAFKNLGQIALAVNAYEKAIQLHPEYADAHFNLGVVYEEQNNHVLAAASYQRALQNALSCCEFATALVHQLQHLCQWDGLTELSQRIVQAIASSESNQPSHFASPYCFITLPIATTAIEQRQCMENWAKRLPTPSAPMYRIVGGSTVQLRNDKIKLGYLSGDFRNHAVAYLVAELFESHDRNRFEVLGYSYGRDDGRPIRSRIVNAFDRFSDIQSESFEASARRIAEDGVDILIDLQGYTTRSRPEILALRPAPIQVNYLGFPSTMGSNAYDYILVDEFVVPSSQQPNFNEKLVHLPDCYQVNDRQYSISSTIFSRSQCGLPDEGFVFCSFNNNQKLTRSMFVLWMRILRSVPGSVLWLPEWNSIAVANLRREAIANGIDPSRLVFATHMNIAEHAARHRLADLSLDTFPYNGHATAGISLRMGVPIVTLTGETFASRVAGSLLNTLGLPELITYREAEYEALAIRLAREPEELANLRAKLARQRDLSSLFDGRVFAKNVEQAYRFMVAQKLEDSER